MSAVTNRDAYFLPFRDGKQVVYLIRHGQSVFNIPDEASGTFPISGKSLTIPLTRAGKDQAFALAERLITQLDPASEVVICSSAALRATQTAKRIVKKLTESGFDCLRGESDERLCEISQGEWEGKLRDENYQALIKTWDKLSAREKMVTTRVCGGESYMEGAERMLAALRSLTARYGEGKTLFVISHGNAINSLVLYLKRNETSLSDVPGTSPPFLELHNCDVVKINLSKEVW